MDSGVKVESMGEAEIAAVNVLSQKTGLNGLSKEVKTWISMPAKWEDRHKLSQELEVLETSLFQKQRDVEGMLEKRRVLCEQISKSTEPSEQAKLKEQLAGLSSHESLLRDISDLESQRAAKLNEYWTKYFSSEWPARAQNAASLRKNMTSPNSYFAAENMLAMRSGAAPSSAAPAVVTSWTDGSPKSKSKKRMFDALLGSSQNSAFISSQSSDGSSSPKRAANDEQSSVRCNCKKSRCLKLYCECFAARKMCVDECKCNDCANNLDHMQERESAIKSVLERRPDAFHTKILVAAVVNGPSAAAAAVSALPQALPSAAAFNYRDLAPVALAHVRGCSCRRTKCTKKYCVCYNTNVKCGEWCRCVGCDNGKVDSNSQSDGAEESAGTDRLSALVDAATPHIRAQ